MTESAERLDPAGGADRRVDQAVQAYIDGIAAEHRPLFDRLHRLILGVHPDADVVLSYDMPTYKVGRRRLFLGAWKHGLSIYGWPRDHDAGFTARHPELKTGKATIQLRPEDAAGIPDDEFRDLVRAALEA
jgi:uncharacterized protein YdhG (YjbR/CyaY superfamily)